MDIWNLPLVELRLRARRHMFLIPMGRKQAAAETGLLHNRCVP